MKLRKMAKLLIGIWIVSTPILAKDYVMLVGVGEFKDSKLYQPLEIKEDIKIIKDALIQNKLQKGYSIIELINKDATKNNIISNLNAISDRLTSNDRFFFYYSGHGTAHSDSSIWKYIRKLDRDDRDFLVDTSAIVPYDFNENDIQNTLLVGSRDFEPIIQEMDKKASEILIILDACFSSEMARGERFNANFSGKKKHQYKNTTRVSSSGRTSNRSGKSNITSIIAKCLKTSSHNKCLRNSKTSDTIRVKD